MADEQFTLSPSATPPPTEADYDAILAAVMETMRGRWFLAEYAKRNRTADTALVLAAIDRVEAALREARPVAGAVSPADRIRFDLVEMANAIAQARAEVASIKPDGDHKGSLSEATEELDSIVHATERATSDILAAAEQVQEIAWTLREHGTDSTACDALDRRAADIYTACSFQDLTGQRTRKVVEVLRFLEQRINAMIDIWGDAIPASDAPDSGAVPPHIHDEPGAERLDQPHIDQMIPGSAAAAPNASDGKDEPRVADEPAVEPAAAAEAERPEAERAEAEPSEPDLPGPDVAEHEAEPPAEAPAPAVTQAAARPAAEQATTQPQHGPERPIVPALAVVGAAAIELSPPEIGPIDEPVPLAKAEREAEAPRSDPAAVLERILAIIHEPIEAPAADGIGEAPPSWQPTSAASHGGGAMPSLTLRPAPEPTRAAARAAAPPTIEEIPFAGYSRRDKLSAVAAMDETFTEVPQVELATSPPAPPPAMARPVPPPTAAAPTQSVALSGPGDRPQAAAVPEPTAMPEPVAEPAAQAECAPADQAGPRVVGMAGLAAAPPRPDPMPQPPAVIEPLPSAEPLRSAASAARPGHPTEQPSDPLPPSPTGDPATVMPPSERLAAAKPAAPFAAPLAEPAPSPRVAAAVAKPATPPRSEGLAAFTALSDEEKIALFS